MQNVRLDETQPGIKFAGQNISNLRYADDTTVFFGFFFVNNFILFIYF